MEFLLTAMKLISPSVNMLTFLLRTLIVLSKVHLFKTSLEYESYDIVK